MANAKAVRSPEWASHVHARSAGFLYILENSRLLLTVSANA